MQIFTNEESKEVWRNFFREVKQMKKDIQRIRAEKMLEKKKMITNGINKNN